MKYTRVHNLYVEPINTSVGSTVQCKNSIIYIYIIYM